ncbi:hypothetical protein [Streptomyces hydrogenans]|uniref:hypothetical protein n=1 Tax=Streptomyces hydrogenans TaxID=1873719 RepID=UPI0038159A91
MPTVTFADGTPAPALAADLAVADRAIAVRGLPALVLSHRPHHVRVQVTPGRPTSAALSAPGRPRRLCGTLSVPLGLDACASAGQPPGAGAS